MHYKLECRMGNTRAALRMPTLSARAWESVAGVSMLLKMPAVGCRISSDDLFGNPGCGFWIKSCLTPFVGCAGQEGAA